MTQFSIKELFRATALIAVGTVMIAGLFQYPPEPGMGLWRGVFPLLVMWCGGWGMIGAGVFAPFHRIWTGVLAGLIFPTLIFLALLAVSSRVSY